MRVGLSSRLGQSGLSIPKGFRRIAGVRRHPRVVGQGNNNLASALKSVDGEVHPPIAIIGGVAERGGKEGMLGLQ